MMQAAFLFLHGRFDVSVVVLAGQGKSFSAGAEVAAGGFAPPVDGGGGGAVGSQRERRHVQPWAHARSFLQHARKYQSSALPRERGCCEDDADAIRHCRHASMLGRRVIKAIMDCEAVTIARVQGHAIGGGFGLMQACDLRVVSDRN